MSSTPLPEPAAGDVLSKLRRINAIQSMVKEFEWIPEMLLKDWDTTDQIERDAIDILLRRAKEGK